MTSPRFTPVRSRDYRTEVTGDEMDHAKEAERLITPGEHDDRELELVARDTARAVVHALLALNETLGRVDSARDDGRHPDECPCQFCEEDRRVAVAQDDDEDDEDDEDACECGSPTCRRRVPGRCDEDDEAERADVLRMRREMAREAGDDSPGADLDDGYPDSERDADALAYQRNGDDERDDQ